MFLRPRLFNLDFVDRLLIATFAENRNSEPSETRHRLDPVAIVPVALGELCPVEYHVFVAPPDQVEETSPGDVARLNDSYPHGFFLNSVRLKHATCRR